MKPFTRRFTAQMFALKRKIVPLTMTWLSLGLLCAGCISRPRLAKEFFALRPPPPRDTSLISSTNVLAIKPVTVSPLFEGKSFVYRTGEHSFEQDAYADFLVSPSRALEIPIRAYLRQAGLFREVVEPGSALRPDHIAEFSFTELYGDFRQPEDTAAVMSVHFILIEDGVARSLVTQKNCTRRVRLKARTAAALVDAWNQALDEIMGEIVDALKRVKQ